MSATERTAIAAKITATFGALRHRDYRVFWTGTCVSFIGTWVQNVALGLYVYRLTGSKEALGAVGLASGLPVTVLLLYGGAIADRVDKRRLLFVTQSIYAASAFALAALVATHLARPWHIIAISFVNGMVFAVDGPARQALVYDLVGPEDLATGVALQSASFNVARVLGPALGSVIYASLGPAWCFATNGLSFGAVLLSLGFIRSSAATRAAEGVAPSEGVRASFQYLRQSLPARTILTLTATASIFGVANYQTLMPAFARDCLRIGEQDARYGFLFSAIGLGSLGGVYYVGRNAQAGRRGLTVITGAVCFALALTALGQARSYHWALLILFAVGLSAVSQLATANSLTQTMAPEGLRGRAVALHMLAMAGLQPVGAFLAGTIAQRLSVGFSLTMGGVIVACVATVLAARYRSVFRVA